MDLPLDQIRDNYRRVTLGFTGQPPEVPQGLAGVEHVRVSGRHVAIIASHNAEAIAEFGRERRAVDIQIAPVSLRELFLETVQEDRNVLV